MNISDARKLCLILEDMCPVRIPEFVKRLRKDFPELSWSDYQYSPWIIFPGEKKRFD